MDAGCGEWCTCSSGEIQCESISCDVNAVCALRDGIRACYCNPPFLGNGLQCNRKSGLISTPVVSYTVSKNDNEYQLIQIVKLVRGLSFRS